MRDVPIGNGESAADIQRKILAAYRAHGQDPPSDFSRTSRFIAAGTARRGTRTVRLLVEAVAAIRAARRWTFPPASCDESSRPEGEETAASRSELRKLGWAAVAYGLVAAASGAGAVRTRGVPRIVLSIVAAFFAAVAAWVITWYIGFSALFRVIRNSGQRG